MSHARSGPAAVLIHGAWQGSWVWRDLVPLLSEAGIEAIAVDLPGNGTDETPPERVCLELYVDHVGEVIATAGGPVVLVGHSGGGIVASAAAERFAENVAGIVYLAGMMLPSGMSFAELQARIARPETEDLGVTPHIVRSPDGLTTSVPPEAACRHFLSDLPRGVAMAAAERLTPQPEGGRAMVPVTSNGRFGRIPRLYVEATGDRSVVLAAQRRMQALVPGARRVSLPTGHVPQVSAPRLVADAIVPFIRSLRPASTTGAAELEEAGAAT